MWTSVDDPHGQMPKLKGMAVDVHSLVPALLNVWRRHMNPDLPEHQAILEGLRCSAVMDEVLDAYPDVDVLPKHAVEDFVNASWQYAQCQNAAADHYNKKLGYFLFDITTKTYCTVHGGCDLKS